MRLKIPQQTQLSSLCLSNCRQSSLCCSASSAINPFPLPSPFRWGEAREGGREGREQDRNAPHPGLAPLSLLALPRGVFCEKRAKRHGLCIGPKITPGGFAGNVVSASPTRSHPAVLFLLPVSLATPQLALAGEPGCCLLPAGPAAASGEAISEANRVGGSRRWGQMLMRDRVLCVQL